MISNPDLPIAPFTFRRGLRDFSPWQLLSLVPGVIPRLEQNGRVLELEVGRKSLLAGLARAYPTSQFIGITSAQRAQRGLGVEESSMLNLHFRVIELIELYRFRKVDLALVLGGVTDHAMIAELAHNMAPGGFMVLREDEKQGRLKHSQVITAFIDSFADVHAIRLPEDPGFLYYVATAA